MFITSRNSLGVWGYNTPARMSLVNLFPEDGDLTFEKKVEKDDCEYTASANRKDDEGDGF